MEASLTRMPRPGPSGTTTWPARLATPGISLGCAFYMPHHVRTEDVLEERVANRAGHVVVPDGPGLGIRVSEASVRANARVLAEA